MHGLLPLLLYISCLFDYVNHSVFLQQLKVDCQHSQCTTSVLLHSKLSYMASCLSCYIYLVFYDAVMENNSCGARNVFTSTSTRFFELAWKVVSNCSNRTGSYFNHIFGLSQLHQCRQGMLPYRFS